MRSPRTSRASAAPRRTTCARRSARRTVRRWPSSSRSSSSAARHRAHRAGDRVAVGDERALGDYSFNKSHAACYTLIAYRTAWLKANSGRVHGRADLLGDGHQGQGAFLRGPGRADRDPDPSPGRQRLRPRVLVVDGNIRFGLDAVKGVRYPAVEAIKQCTRIRSQPPHPRPKPFLNLFDFCAGSTAGRQQEGDRGADRMRCFRLHGATRKGMVTVLEQAQAAGKKVQQDAEIGQGSIFE